MLAFPLRHHSRSSKQKLIFRQQSVKEIVKLAFGLFLVVDTL